MFRDALRPATLVFTSREQRVPEQIPVSSNEHQQISQRVHDRASSDIVLVDFDRQDGTHKPLKVLAMLLLAFNSPAGWQLTEHGFSLDINKPCCISQCDVMPARPIGSHVASNIVLGSGLATEATPIPLMLGNTFRERWRTSLRSGTGCQACIAEEEPTPDAGVDTTQQVPQQMRLTSIFRYPIKSARAEALDEAEVTAEGLRGDRRFVVTLADGTGLTQRTHPVLATIQVCMADDKLSLRAADGKTCTISVKTSGSRSRVKLFKDDVQLIDQGSEVGQWLEEVLDGGAVENPMLRFLGMTRYKLFFAPDDSWQGDGERLRGGAGLSDLAPLLLVCEESLQELNTRRVSEGLQCVPLDRFRPNLVVSGSTMPHAEADAWKSVRIGNTEFAVVGPCPRCTVPDVDQDSGTKDKRKTGPMTTLMKYRTRKTGVMFGVYVAPLDTGEVVRVGDVVEADLNSWGISMQQLSDS